MLPCTRHNIIPFNNRIAISAYPNSRGCYVKQQTAIPRERAIPAEQQKADENPCKIKLFAKRMFQGTCAGLLATAVVSVSFFAVTSAIALAGITILAATGASVQFTAIFLIAKVALGVLAIGASLGLATGIVRGVIDIFDLPYPFLDGIFTNSNSIFS